MDWRPEWAQAAPETWNRIESLNKFRSAVLAYFKGISKDLRSVESELTAIENADDYGSCAIIYQALQIDLLEDAKRLYLELLQKYPPVENTAIRSHAVVQFLEYAREIRARILSSPNNWFDEVFSLCIDLEQKRKEIIPEKLWGFVLTQEERIHGDEARNLQERIATSTSRDPGRISQDATGTVYHFPSEPMVDIRWLGEKVQKKTLLWFCDPYQETLTIRPIQIVFWKTDNKIFDLDIVTKDGEVVPFLDKWIRFAENRLQYNVSKKGFVSRISPILEFESNTSSALLDIPSYDNIPRLDSQMSLCDLEMAIPKLSDGLNAWIKASSIEMQRDYKLQVGTLRTARSKGEKNKESSFGRDKQCRVWRVDPHDDRVIWYWRESLAVNQRRREKDRDR